jgi:surface antigen
LQGLQVVESREDTLQTHEQNRKSFRQSYVANYVTRFFLVAVFGLLLVAFFSVDVTRASANVQSTTCTAGEQSHTVAAGETLSGIAARYGLDWQKIAQRNHLANPNRILINQKLCISPSGTTSDAQLKPASTTVQTNPNTSTTGKTPAVGTGNYFPYAQCTWWANQRYHQLHGVYVPWTTRSNAYQWKARAPEFGWRVYDTPQKGDIMVLQPYIQGATGYGHVAIVEQVLGQGKFIASSMNWAPAPRSVTRAQFHTGRGVSFIHK